MVFHNNKIYTSSYIGLSRLIVFSRLFVRLKKCIVMICLILLVWFRENHIPAKSTKWSARSVCIWSIRHHNKLASGKLALHHWKSNCHRWRFDYFDMCSLSHETYIKWELRCSTVWRKGKGTQKLYVTSQIWNVNEIELVDTTKIMISLCKAKPEWFSPSDIRQVIFADF